MLPPTLKDLEGTELKTQLKKWLMERPVYSIKEYLDLETRMATVKRLMDSVLELVEANVDVEDQTNKIPEKRPAETSEQQPAKRVKREDSETSDRSKDEKKGSKASKKTSSESSSASDSDSESSSSESTTSDSSEDSDDSSDEDKSTDDKKEEGADSDDDKGDWKKEQEYLTTACLDALEDCAQRFPEHYKSLYRLAHFYFRSKLRRNVEKARQLLLGEKGLFADRKPSNFFNGVWRIPSNEIDRPGSFASHMSRCVLLLVDVLRDTCDHKMLFDLALHLKDTPEADKKYLRDPEREELSKEALSLSVQTLRRKLTEAKSEDDQKTILIEIYKVYKLCSKHWDVKQGQFVTLLTDAFSQYKEENNGGFDAAVKFCTQEIAMQKAAATPTPSSAPQTAFSSPDVSQASSPAPLMPPMQQKPPPMPTPPVKRGRGRPSTSSLRQQNPNAFKQNYRSSAEELAQFYRNMVTMQMMNQSKAGQSGPLLNQQMLTNAAAMALSYQTEMYQQLLLQQQQVQKAAQLQAMKDHTKVNITPVSSHQKPDTSTKASSLLAPSKVSVFSSQSILLPNQKPVAKQTSKPQSSLSISPVVVSTPNSAIYQHGTQTQFTPARAPVQPSPFQQKIPVEPKVSLQHKLLSAKMGKQITTSLVTSTQQQSSVIASSDRTKHTKDKVSLQKTSSLSLQKSSSLPTAALSSRGVSIIPAKLPEIKIPKDITLGHGLSISPLNSSKSKSSLSPSTSKEVTVTLMKSQSDLKNSKAGSSVSVSLLENKKSQLSPGGGRNSPSATLRMGSSVTITPAKPVKSVPQVKPIPKADFSISLSKPTDTKKKDGSDVIIIE
ncbi:Calcineurin-binding protein cabin-1 [Homalodisca vitripennis]|nr:Calcineurin-binding protein cabin-1 [Homalodisca vitripennis]